jgi:hypothetical protein
MLAGCVFFAIVFYFWRSGRELRENGRTAGALVVKKFRKPGGGIENFYIHASFKDEAGIAREAGIKVLSRAWRSLREGETTQITYLPGRPEAAAYGPRAGRLVIGYALFFMLIVAGCLIVTAFASFLKELTSPAR